MRFKASADFEFPPLYQNIVITACLLEIDENALFVLDSDSTTGGLAPSGIAE
jgi:hypothetical protein